MGFVLILLWHSQCKFAQLKIVEIETYQKTVVWNRKLNWILCIASISFSGTFHCKLRLEFEIVKQGENKWASECEKRKIKNRKTWGAKHTIPIIVATSHKAHHIAVSVVCSDTGVRVLFNRWINEWMSLFDEPYEKQTFIIIWNCLIHTRTRFQPYIVTK